MALYTMAFIGLSPLGALFGGAPQGFAEESVYLLPASGVHNVLGRPTVGAKAPRESHTLGKALGTAKTCHPRREKIIAGPRFRRVLGRARL